MFCPYVHICSVVFCACLCQLLVHTICACMCVCVCFRLYLHACLLCFVRQARWQGMLLWCMCVRVCMDVSWDVWMLVCGVCAHVHMWVCACVAVLLRCVWMCVQGLFMSVPCVPVIRMRVHACVSVCVCVCVVVSCAPPVYLNVCLEYLFLGQGVLECSRGLCVRILGGVLVVPVHPLRLCVQVCLCMLFSLCVHICVLCALRVFCVLCLRCVWMCVRGLSMSVRCVPVICMRVHAYVCVCVCVCCGFTCSDRLSQCLP